MRLPLSRMRYAAVPIMSLVSGLAMTRAIRRLETDGHPISDEVPAVLNPYQTAHINRFGNYSMNFGSDPQPRSRRFSQAATVRISSGESLAVPDRESGFSLITTR